MVVSVGASGALMGITGAYLAHWLVVEFKQKKHDEPTGVYSAFAQILAINLVSGFITPGVDNACHLGGLVSGAILGGLFAFKLDYLSIVMRLESAINHINKFISVV